jgi:hypothetical protein
MSNESMWLHKISDRLGRIADCLERNRFEAARNAQRRGLIKELRHWALEGPVETEDLDLLEKLDEMEKELG